ncbi:hypothetical protein Celgi_0131 [Cellulomonas gilvus ATCC 13127]|uniref:Uncharacterized protein n=1 Tax=Cellulomonas gilvus (strain ATCC 13127 / NRRL B-14078) TaxID=593907 RepID=F8A2U5_CELGA|nr:hypothetical protein Celgi_0131 [Cellulomonas gilvus ATCC 13127]
MSVPLTGPVAPARFRRDRAERGARARPTSRVRTHGRRGSGVPVAGRFLTARPARTAAGAAGIGLALS